MLHPKLFTTKLLVLGFRQEISRKTVQVSARSGWCGALRWSTSGLFASGVI
jgi:hypothetical protein